MYSCNFLMTYPKLKKPLVKLLKAMSLQYSDFQVLFFGNCKPICKQFYQQEEKTI